MIILYLLPKELCPADFVTAPFVGSCYYAYSRYLLIEEAKSACQNIHVDSRLVSIETNTEHDFIRHYLEEMRLQEGRLIPPYILSCLQYAEILASISDEKRRNTHIIFCVMPLVWYFHYFKLKIK